MGRPPKVTIPEDQLRSPYVDDGLSTAEIAARFGVNSESIRTRLIRAGIQRRPALVQPGPKNPAWRGGRIVDKAGYLLVLVPHHPNANSGGYVREHRLVMEEMLGRLLEPHEVVHHRDGNPQNNSPENLELFQSNGDHLREELAGRVPNWSPEGRDRILVACRDAPQPEWTDERRQKARDRMNARWRNGGIPGAKWTAEERERARRLALQRKRRPDGSFE